MVIALRMSTGWLITVGVIKGGGVMFGIQRKCYVCGQRITDATGEWHMTLADYGIFTDYTAKSMVLCGSCKEMVTDFMHKLMSKGRLVS